MIVLNNDLWAKVMNNLSFDKQDVLMDRIDNEVHWLNEEDKDKLRGALETDINYWENCLKEHPNEKESILRHIRNYIKCDNKLMEILSEED